MSGDGTAASTIFASQKGCNVKVCVRVRPMNKREREGRCAHCVGVTDETQVIVKKKAVQGRADRPGSSAVRPLTFSYDRVFAEEDGQDLVFNTAVSPVVDSVLEGYNGSVIAYGQTGTGKTFTIEGELKGETQGIIPRSVHRIFQHIQDASDSRCQWLVRVSFLQIYNERVSDLLEGDKDNLKIREGARGVWVQDLSEHVARRAEDVYALLSRGKQQRKTNSTRKNETSSRSHAVFTVIVERSEETDSGTTVTVGKLHLVDLAGSERFEASSSDVRMRETTNINTSLSAFGKVVIALTSKTRKHTPYRDSKLTRILQDSLGGNCLTTMISTISPASDCLQESTSTLQFANVARSVKNVVSKNEDKNETAMLSAYQSEVKRLRAMLDKSSSVRPQQQQQQQQEEVEAQAEMAGELERRTREAEAAKRAQEALQTQIAELQAKMLTGGRRIEETEAFQEAVKRERDRIRKEQQHQLEAVARERAKLEQERRAFEERKKQWLRTQATAAATAAANGHSDAGGGGGWSAESSSNAGVHEDAAGEKRRFTPSPPKTPRPSDSGGGGGGSSSGAVRGSRDYVGRSAGAVSGNGAGDVGQEKEKAAVEVRDAESVQGKEQQQQQQQQQMEEKEEEEEEREKEEQEQQQQQQQQQHHKETREQQQDRQQQLPPRRVPQPPRVPASMPRRLSDPRLRNASPSMALLPTRVPRPPPKHSSTPQPSPPARQQNVPQQQNVRPSPRVQQAWAAPSAANKQQQQQQQQEQEQEQEQEQALRLQLQHEQQQQQQPRMDPFRRPSAPSHHVVPQADDDMPSPSLASRDFDSKPLLSDNDDDDDDEVIPVDISSDEEHMDTVGQGSLNTKGTTASPSIDVTSLAERQRQEREAAALVEEQGRIAAYRRALMDPSAGIPLGSHRIGLTLYSSCFRGSDAAGWFMANMEGVSTVQRAQSVGQNLLDLGMFVVVRGGMTFNVSDSALYAFDTLEAETYSDATATASTATLGNGSTSTHSPSTHSPARTGANSSANANDDSRTLQGWGSSTSLSRRPSSSRPHVLRRRPSSSARRSLRRRPSSSSSTSSSCLLAGKARDTGPVGASPLGSRRSSGGSLMRSPHEAWQQQQEEGLQQQHSQQQQPQQQQPKRRGSLLRVFNRPGSSRRHRHSSGSGTGMGSKGGANLNASTTSVFSTTQGVAAAVSIDPGGATSPPSAMSRPPTAGPLRRPSGSALRRRAAAITSFASLFGGSNSTNPSGGGGGGGVGGDIGCQHDPTAREALDLDTRVPVVVLEEAPAAHRAAANGDVAAIKAFARTDPDSVCELDEMGRSPLMYAAIANRVKVCKQLLKVGAMVNACDDNGCTALLWAVTHGCRDVMRLLLKHGADPDAVDNKGQTCVHWACAPASTDVLQLVLRVCQGSILDHQDQYGQTPLHWCVLCGHNSHAQLLLQHGADASLVDCEGRTPLHYAVELGDAGCLDVLTRLCGPPVLSQPDARGYAALHLAVSRGDMGTFSTLVGTHGMDVNQADSHGRTPLHYAALLGQASMCGALVDAGAAVMARDGSGRTALHLAIDKGQSECIQVLQVGMSNATAQPPVPAFMQMTRR